MNKEKENKRMTLDDRIEIQDCLSKEMTFKKISERIGKDPTTVSKEVKKSSPKKQNSKLIFNFRLIRRNGFIMTFHSLACH